MEIDLRKYTWTKEKETRSSERLRGNLNKKEHGALNTLAKARKIRKRPQQKLNTLSRVLCDCLGMPGFTENRESC